MARFHLPRECWGPEAALTGDEARHLSQVLRVREGGHISVFDGMGASAPAEVVRITRHRVELRIGEIGHSDARRPAVLLAQAVPKGKTMDWIVQKSVELGVAEIQPLITRNTVVQVGDDEAPKKREKWQRVALEACKQCGQNFLPAVAEPCDFASWIAGVGEMAGVKLIASLTDGARPFREVLRDLPGVPDAVTLLIGPEGDFTPEETSAALAAGFVPVTLGDIVLRVETASLFGMSALRYEFA
jgi:16S rRNA (uracil1498-N3)-methyltransferase